MHRSSDLFFFFSFISFNVVGMSSKPGLKIFKKGGQRGKEDIQRTLAAFLYLPTRIVCQ